MKKCNNLNYLIDAFTINESRRNCIISKLLDMLSDEDWDKHEER